VKLGVADGSDEGMFEIEGTVLGFLEGM